MSAGLSRLLGHEPARISFVIGSSVAVTLAVVAIARLALHSTPRKIVPSPRATLLPKLSKAEQEDLPYPPDVFPGARDVESPVRILVLWHIYFHKTRMLNKCCISISTTKV